MEEKVCFKDKCKNFCKKRSKETGFIFLFAIFAIYLFYDAETEKLNFDNPHFGIKKVPVIFKNIWFRDE